MSPIGLENLETWPYSVQRALSLVSMFPQGTSGWRMRSKSMLWLFSIITQTLSRLLYRPSYVTDGNFKLEHLAMRRPDDDVFLQDGQGHIVGREPYRCVRGLQRAEAVGRVWSCLALFELDSVLS